MKNLTIKNIARVCGGIYRGPEELTDREITSVTTDSRKAEPGCLFVPIVGERVDGHSFIPQVMEKGALVSLSERDLAEDAGAYIRVGSSTDALKALAEFYLEQLGIPVVGITGSVGKTSTKEMIAAVLQQKYRTLKTQGNFNNEIGLPLTVFRLTEEHEIAVLEMGISDFGEMSRLARIARPDTAVITNIGTCHLENLGDRDGVLRAKTEVLDFLRPGGHIVLNGDDDKLATVKERNGIRPVFFGLSDQADVYADEIVSRGLLGSSCRIHLGEEVFSVEIPMPGRHMVSNALAAAAVGRIYGLTSGEIQRGIASLEPVNGRFQMLQTNRFLIVNDCYNANPMSMKASLDVLKDADGRKVAILGDMGELGSDEIELHREVGRHAAACGLDLCICTGPLCREMAKAASETAPALRVIWEPDRESLISHLAGYVEDGDTILVKASRFMGFEKVVECLREC